jgi:hypothetical protein
MKIIEELLQDIPFPRMIKVQQKFHTANGIFSMKLWKAIAIFRYRNGGRSFLI